ncbi:ankyrin repeat domain-containing protein [Rickettsiella endosymbiont of Aleochara curtula]|uniref:ankyrin repeat domain-containing protein n=1 Tax=Rickettsiella endosymbiont of Aleochara curtula TaxID=3077936 RepID=UPI00313D5531
MPVLTQPASSAVSYSKSAYKIVDQQYFNEVYTFLADFIETKINSNDLRIRLNDARMVNLYQWKNELYEKINKEFNRDDLHPLLIQNQVDGKILLHEAAAKGNNHVITFLKNTGHNINMQDSAGITPLTEACRKNLLGTFDLVLSYGADPKLGGNYAKNTPLRALIEAETVDERKEANIAEKLINGGGGEWQTEKGDSSLQLAIMYNKKLIAETIAHSYKVDINHVNTYGETALHMLSEFRTRQEQSNEDHMMRNELDLAQSLYFHLDKITHRDHLGNTALHTAVINGNFYIVDFLLKRDFSFKDIKISTIQNNEGMTAIHEAVLNGRKKCLDILISVSTPKDLAVVNNAGQTALQMAEDLIQQIPKLLSSEDLRHLARSIRNLDNQLINEATRLDARQKLFESVEILIGKFKELSASIIPINIDEDNVESNLEDLIENLEEFYDLEDNENPNYHSETNLAKQLSEKLNTIKLPSKEFFNDIVSDLKKNSESLKQTESRLWKEAQLQLDSSFPELQTTQPIIDVNSQEYQIATGIYNVVLTQYSQKLADPLVVPSLEHAVELYKQAAPNSHELVNTFTLLKFSYQNTNQETKIPGILEKIIEIAYQQKDYWLLESTAQELVQIYIKNQQASVYESKNINTLINSLLTQKERLVAHLILASLYQELNQLSDPELYGVNREDLKFKASYHYSEVYQLGQGPTDASARLILQREVGIARNENIGTYNIQQCVVVVAHDPLAEITCLYHVDRFSSPLIFRDQLLAQFPGNNPVHIWLSGGRDRSMQNQEISDNNIDFVLKQFHALKNNPTTAHKFQIMATDLGDKISPQAVVFDRLTKKLVHAMPTKPDIGQNYRTVKRRLQNHKDYARPLSIEVFLPEFKVDEQAKKLIFHPDEINQLKQLLKSDTKSSASCEAWFHDQIYYPLSSVLRDIENRPSIINDRLLQNFPVPMINQNVPVIAHDTQDSMVNSAENLGLMDMLSPGVTSQESMFDFDLSLFSQDPALPPPQIPATQNLELAEYLNQENLKSFADFITNMDMQEIQKLNLAPKITDNKRKNLGDHDDDENFSAKKPCFSGSGNRKKRSTGEACLYSQSDIDEFNIADNKNKFDEMHIDSTAFIKYIHGMDVAKKSQLLLEVAAKAKIISGKDAQTLRRLIYIEQIRPKLNLVSSVSASLMHGLIAKDTLVALLRGDAETVAINFGLLGLGYGTEVASTLLQIHALGLINKGQKYLGKFLLGTSKAFVRRGTSLFIGWDLYEQIKALKGGDKEALANIIGDSLTLGMELGQAGIEVLELSEVIAGVSDFTGPAGELIGAFTLLGVQIYHAVRSVGRLDEILHLNNWQKLREGVYAFIGIPFSKDLIEKADLVEQYKHVLQQKFEILKNHTEIRRYFFPDIQEVVRNCHDVEVYQEDQCMQVSDFGQICGSPKYREVCDETFPNVNTSRINLLEKKHNIKLRNDVPIKPDDSEFTCLPTGNSKPVPAAGAYQCEGAIGLEHANRKSGINYFAFENGHHSIFGFPNETNVFYVGEGRKQFVGSNMPDIFLLNGNATGELRGFAGSDSLDASNFYPSVECIEADFHKEYFVYGPNRLYIQSIEQFKGRANKCDNVNVGCGTEVVDTQGGTPENPDRILIPPLSCDFNLKLGLTANTVITNEAKTGNFTYAISPKQGNMTVFLMDKGGRHNFIIDSNLSELSSIEGLNSERAKTTVQDIQFNFFPYSLIQTARNIEHITFYKSSNESLVNVAYQSTGSDLSNSTLPVSLDQTAFQEILRAYPQSIDAESFNFTFNDTQQVRGVMAYLLQQVEAPPYANDILNARGVTSTNSIFYLTNGIEFKMDVQNQLYLFYNTEEQSVEEIIKTYTPVAQRLKITCFIENSLENKLVVIGDDRAQIMSNDPKAEKTHLVSTGNSKLYVVTPSSESSLQLPLSEVIIHRIGDINYTQMDTLDLRAITNFVKTQFGKNCKLLFVPPNAVNHAGKDLLLLVALDIPGPRIREIMTIRLKDSIENNWYKTLHVILNVAPQRIMGPSNKLYLEPINLEFANKYQLITVSPRDIELNTTLNIHRNLSGLRYYRDGENLLLTNLLNTFSKIIAPFTLLLEKFNQIPQLKQFETLRIKFLDQKLIVGEELAKLQLAADFNQSLSLYKKIWDRYSLLGLNNTQNQTMPTFATTLMNNTMRQEISSNDISRNKRSLPLQFNFEAKIFSSGSTLHSKGIFQVIKNSIKEIGEMINDQTRNADLLEQLKISARKFGQSLSKIPNSKLDKTILKKTELSTRVIKVPSFFNRANQIFYGGLSGVPTGIISGAVEVYSHSKESSIGSIIMLKVALDLLMQYSQFTLSQNLDIWSGEETQISLPSNGFNLLCMSIFQGLSIGLANSDGFWHKSAQKGIQAISSMLFMYAMFNFFFSEDSAEEKVTRLLNFCSFAIQAKLANQVTHRVLKSQFFRSSTIREINSSEQDAIINNSSEGTSLGI